VLVFRHAQPGDVLGADVAAASQKMAALYRNYAEATAQYPETPPHRLLFPRNPGAPVIERVQLPNGELHALHLNAETGAIQARLVEGEDAMSWIADLHEGDWFGRYGRNMVGFGGLLGAVMVLAGLLAWTTRHGRLWSETVRPVAGLCRLRRLRNLHHALATLAALPTPAHRSERCGFGLSPHHPSGAEDATCGPAGADRATGQWRRHARRRCRGRPHHAPRLVPRLRRYPRAECGKTLFRHGDGAKAAPDRRSARLGGGRPA
jgi:hypothetical protein